jgi:hypothetical protein
MLLLMLVLVLMLFAPTSALVELARTLKRNFQHASLSRCCQVDEFGQTPRLMMQS